MLRRAVLVFLGVILAACGQIGVPQVTPTAPPTRTPTPTNEATEIAEVPSRTPLPTATETDAPTTTPSATVTSSPTDAATATDTEIPTSTPLPLPQDTNTPTPTATPTDTPTATSTLTPQPTATDTPTPSATATFTPPPTRTPDLTGTALSAATPTPQPTDTQEPPTATDPPAVQPPTQDVTPTFATLAPDDVVPEDLDLSTPVLSDEEAPVFTTETPTPAPTVANVVPPPTITSRDIFNLPAPNTGGQAFALVPGAGGQIFNLGTGIDSPTFYVQNPVDPGRYLAINDIGLLFDVSGGQANRPSTQLFATNPTTREDNNAVVVDAAWAPDGEAYAFVVDSYSVDEQATGDDGVWFFAPGTGELRKLLVNCPDVDSGQCFATSDAGPYEYIARSVLWSPNSELILTSLYSPDYERDFMLVLTRDQDYNFRPAPLFYDYADWTPDNRLVVSGRRPNSGDQRQHVILGYVDPDGSDEQIVLNGTERGLWLQDGVQGADGLLYALGRPGDANGAMAIYDQTGTARTGVIGSVPPVAVKWNPSRDTVYVRTADGLSYLASVNGTITDITAQVGEQQAIAWISGRLPTSNPDTGTTFDPQLLPTDFVPSGVVEGSRYQPGQQLRVQSGTGQLNLRGEPSVNAEIVGNALNGEYIAILAGPRLADGVEWWQIQTASGTVAWIAALIEGEQVLVP